MIAIQCPRHKPTHTDEDRLVKIEGLNFELLKLIFKNLMSNSLMVEKSLFIHWNWEQVERETWEELN